MSARTALLRTVWLYASAGFAYVAVSAVFRPRQVGDHLWHSLPWLRKDTFGIACFAVSGLAYLLLGLAARRPPRSAAQAVLATIAGYGFAGWAYIACNAIAHPYTLTRPLTHLAAWPHEDEFGILCFAASGAAYFLLQLSKASHAH